MKIDRPLPPAGLATLQTVLDCIAGSMLPQPRKRDCISAVRCFARLAKQRPEDIPLNLGAIRHELDRVVPPKALISPKRFSNLRSDLTAAIDASGLCPILITARVELAVPWRQLLAEAPAGTRHALSRFAHWATLRGIAPGSVNGTTFAQFDRELHSASLVRNLRHRSRLVRRAWNVLAADRSRRLKVVLLEADPRVLKRLPLASFPVTFRNDIDAYAAWGSAADPLDDAARSRALRPSTLRLQRQHLHSAASAAVAAGILIKELNSLAALTEPETVRTLLRYLRKQAGDKPTQYLHGIAITLIAVASEWVKAPAETVAALKALRRKIGLSRPA